jgi:protein SCO1/2
LLLISFIYFGCGEKLPVIHDLSNKTYSLINQDSRKVSFPNDYKGEIVVIGFIFTHCPDICPLTTHNMEMIEKKLNDEKIRNVHFIGFSFDPERDSPGVLTEFANVRDIKFDQWSFLTGARSEVDSIKAAMGVVAIPTDTTIDESGNKSYYYIHTDRISLIDRDGKVRKNYPGSTIKIDEIINDIKTLEG